MSGLFLLVFGLLGDCGLGRGGKGSVEGWEEGRWQRREGGGIAL